MITPFMPKCNRLNCQKIGTHVPIMEFTALVDRGKSDASVARGEMGFVLCEDHASKDVADFVTDEGWQKIYDGVVDKGYAEPDRASIKITYRYIS